MSILVIAPHADDEVLGCGGALGLASSHGIDVIVVVATSGTESVFSEAQKETVRREMEAAHRVMGVSRTIRLEMPAPGLDALPEYQLIDKLVATIREVQPTVVLTPHMGDPHADHNAVSRSVLVATRPRQGQPVTTVLEYETPSESEWSLPHESHWFVPNAYVDVARFLEVKIDAMSCYRSQLREFPHPRSLDYIRYLAHVRGASVGVIAAEAFRLLRTTSGGPLWFGSSDLQPPTRS
jgi:LmbE family N-acetylglucosaminyl deacetylase